LAAQGTCGVVERRRLAVDEHQIEPPRRELSRILGPEPDRSPATSANGP
jgi:hypothetical protein